MGLLPRGLGLLHGASLADRDERSGIPRASDQLSPSPGGEDRRPTGKTHGRHCWVRDPPDAPGIWPGLLVEWRQREDGWHGRAGGLHHRQVSKRNLMVASLDT
ncbi:MAG: uncharacterized protein JWO67_4062 [Streptosporangiaceae bacterium]|nr:uncharacterized protein [Streptosporangiaceae bacterium]